MKTARVFFVAPDDDDEARTRRETDGRTDARVIRNPAVEGRRGLGQRERNMRRTTSPPRLRRQSTTEFLGKLLGVPGNPGAGGGSGTAVRGAVDVDDGRVGALAREQSEDGSEPGSPFGGGRSPRRRLPSWRSAGDGLGFAPDPYPLNEVTFAREGGGRLRGEDFAAFGTTTTTTEPTTAEPTTAEPTTRRKSSRRAATPPTTTTTINTKSSRKSGRRTTTTTTNALAASNAGGFQSASLGKVNAQHSANDLGDHHGWVHIPKRADRRRAIARFTTAIIRAAGHQSFISREGVGYRKAFDRFLVETYGDTFSEGGYWYKNAEIEPFFRMIVYIATDGRVNIANDDVKYLFTKKEERQAAEWVLDEVVLGELGLTAKDVALVYEGKPRTSKGGFARGTPLKVPSGSSMPPEPAPSLEAIVRGGCGNGDSKKPAASMPPPPARVPTPALTAASTVPPDIQKLFDTVPRPNVAGLTRAASRQMSRQYSSDLSRLMSEFNANPSIADDYVRSYLARSASELDAIAAIQAKEKKTSTSSTKRTRRS